MTLAERVQARLVGHVGGGPTDPDAVAALVRQEAPLLPEAGVADAVSVVLAAVEGLGPLQPLLADPAVSDVLVNGGGAVWVERSGRLERTTLRLAPAEVERLIERIVAPLGLRADRASPLVDV